MNKKVWSLILSIIATALLLFLLFTQIEVSDIFSALQKLSWPVLIAGFGLYVLMYFFRGLRFWFLLDKLLSLDKLVTITTLHTALANILPFRTGELSYVYFLKKEAKANLGTGLGSLALARLFDLFAISLLFFLTVLLIPELPRFADTARIVIATILGILVLKLGFLVLFSKQVIKFLGHIFLKLGFHRSKFSKWLLKKIEETTHSLHVVKSWKIVVGALLSSIGVWVCQFGLAFLIFRDIGIDVSFYAIILASSVASLLSILPIQGLIGFGTTEAFWTVALVGVGISTQSAIEAGFAFHFVAIAFFVLTGIYGLIRLNLENTSS
jgi:uncharacterized protein (TIRG00374 family)